MGPVRQNPIQLLGHCKVARRCLKWHEPFTRQAPGLQTSHY